MPFDWPSLAPVLHYTIILFTCVVSCILFYFFILCVVLYFVNFHYFVLFKWFYFFLFFISFFLSAYNVATNMLIINESLLLSSLMISPCCGTFDLYVWPLCFLVSLWFYFGSSTVMDRTSSPISTKASLMTLTSRNPMAEAWHRVQTDSMELFKPPPNIFFIHIKVKSSGK